MSCGMRKQYCRLLSLAAGIAFIIGACALANFSALRRKEILIVPGLKWKYYSERRSCLSWDGFGTIAEGRIDLLFCDFGLCVYSPNSAETLYLDLVGHKILKMNEVGTNLWDNIGVVFSIDAQTAMGINDCSGKILFEQALCKLNERIRKATNDAAQ